MKSFNLMSVLLRFQGYPPATIFAVSLHAAIFYFLLDKDIRPADMVNLDEPVYISALTIQENPQRLRRIENERRIAAAEDARRREQEAARQREAEQQRQQQQREQAQQEQAAREAEQQRIERERINQERLVQEQERREQELAEARAREERLRQDQEAEAQRLAQEEASRRAAEQQAVADEQTASAYKAEIIRIISENWSIPPSARNGMSVVIQLNLVPTGEVVSVNILESSGDSAFDRSGLQAVARAGSFPIVQEMPNRAFERGGFRSISLIFRPEDLLR